MPSHHRMSSNDKVVPTSLNDSHQSELEVEKKFPVPIDQTEFTNLKKRLTSLGFQMTHQEEFVDWYFDLPSPNWYFSLNDIWIRYREKKWKIDKNTYGWRGVWQVKRDEEKGKTDKNDDGITVYKEYQGSAAKEMILDLLTNLENDSVQHHLEQVQSILNLEYQDVPHLDGAEKFVPFSRFTTFRSCWQISPDGIEKDSAYSNLKVDIDRTDFGFAVGEVEAVFRSSNGATDLDEQKANICNLVDSLTTGQNREINCDDASVLTMGKLEYYLYTNSKDHYDACVKAGVI